MQPERVHKIQRGLFDWMPIILFLFLGCWLVFVSVTQQKNKAEIKLMYQEAKRNRDSVVNMMTANQDTIKALLRELK